MATYKLSLDSCESNPKILVTFDEVPENVLEQAISIAKSGFRSIEAVSNETGEVVLSYYVGLQLHRQTLEYGTVIDIIKGYCEKE